MSNEDLKVVKKYIFNNKLVNSLSTGSNIDMYR